MDISIGMRHDRIVKFRDDLTAAIDKNPSANNGATEVVVYAKDNVSGSDITVTINNDDMERNDVSPEEIYVEVTE